MCFQAVSLLLGTCYGVTIRLNSSVTSDFHVRLDWTSDVAGSRFAFTPYQQSPYVLNNEWHSLTTVNFENDTVRVLNIYPEVDEIVEMTFGKSSDTHLLPKSASAKVWMEGGTITENGTTETFEPAGKNPFGSNQIITVDIMTMSDFRDRPSVIWNYDVMFLGTWDANGVREPISGGYNYLNDASLAEIEKYIRSRSGVLAGHDTIVGSSFFGRCLAPLRRYFNIEVQSSSPCDMCDTGDRWHYMSDRVYIEDIDGGLTMWPHKLTNATNRVLTIPKSHTVDNSAMGKIWMSFYNGSYDQFATPTVPRKSYTYFLTTNECTAMIQTGHSKCQSTIAERNIIANTLYYLRQRAPVAHSLVDRTASDRVGPTAPECNVTRTGDTVRFKCRADDQPCLYHHLVRGYDTNGWLNFTASRTVTTDVRSGVYRFSWWTDDVERPFIPSQLRNITTYDGAVESDVVHSTKRYLHVFATDRAGNDGEFSTYSLGKMSTVSFSSIENNTSLELPKYMGVLANSIALCYLRAG